MKNLNENNNKNNSNTKINNIIKKQKDEIEFSNKINSPIQISQKKAQSILEKGGMIDAYKYLISHLCKNGMPTGDLYEYCSIVIKNYEKVWKKKKYKLLNEEIQKRFEDKNNNIQYKVLERRELNQFIKKLDHSRSTIRIIRKNPIMSPNIMNKNINNEMNINKPSIFDRNKNRNQFKKINGVANKNRISGDDKKIDFRIKIKNTGKEKNEGGKSNNSNFINTKSSNKNNTKSKISDNNKLIKNTKINNNSNSKKENNKSNIKETSRSNKNNNISIMGKKEDNKNGSKSSSKSILKKK